MGKVKGGNDKEPSAVDQRREKALEAALQQIEKNYGKGSIMRLSAEQVVPVDGVPTGSLGLDLALGGQGIPRGRICELFGPECSGKTTLGLQVLANCQKAGGMAAFIDAEHGLDPTWARKVGVKLDNLLISQPSCGEEALEICDMLVRSNAVDVIVIDSVAALIPRAEIEGAMGDQHLGLQARLMSQAMRKLTGFVAKTRTCVVFINQIRMKIGVMFGNPETTPGGNALKFYSSVRIDIRRVSTIKEGDRAVGNRVRARVVKNKVAPPYRSAEFDILFDRGIDGVGDLLDLATGNGVVAKQGAWLSFGDVRLGQGREASRNFLAANADLCQEVRRAVLDKVAAGAAEKKDSSTPEQSPPA
jgi:recombination protein RecA